MIIFVSGAAGFIGSNMVNYLINNTSCEIVGVDNFDNGIKNKKFIKILARKLEWMGCETFN